MKKLILRLNHFIQGNPASKWSDLDSTPDISGYEIYILLIMLHSLGCIPYKTAKGSMARKTHYFSIFY